MMIDYDNSNNILIQARIYYTLNKTRNTISRFRIWKTKRHMDLVFYPRKSPRSGQWLYYNIRGDRQGWEEIKLRQAKDI